MFKSMRELVEAAVKEGKSIGEIVLENECKVSGRSRDEAWNDMVERWRIMKESIEHGVKGEFRIPYDIVPRYGPKLHSHNWRFLSGVVGRAVARAFAVSEYNAAMGKICAAPTAGAAGVLPAVLSSIQEERRNCFVAITRSSRNLYLSYAKKYFGWNKKPSRFLREMGLINEF